MSSCPTCGQDLPVDAPLRVSLDTNEATANGLSVKLRPTVAECLFAILEEEREFGRPITASRIMDKVYGVWGDSANQGTMRVHLFRLRESLREIGWDLALARDGLGHLETRYWVKPLDGAEAA